MKAHRVVLAPQDTTTLNYSTHPMTEGLGPINTVENKAVGLLLHDTLAFSEGGTPLGILDAQCWARDSEDRGKRVRRHELPIEQKESMKWLHSFRKVAQIQALCPETILVSMGDRESDIYELFWEASKDPHGPKLLTRAEKTRHRPKGTSYPSVAVWVVHVLEQDHENGEPIEWMLYTTMEVQSFEDAKKRVEWYAGQWGIEVYHRTLKSSCRIKDRQLSTADRLETCLGVDMVVAWRIFYLTMLGRETPDVPCTVFFKDVEWKALCCYVSKKSIPPVDPPLLKKAIQMVGAIGGHMGRKSDGPPGIETLWRRLQRLDTATEMFVIFTYQQLPLRESDP